jgi:hypothetical protein
MRSIQLDEKDGFSGQVVIIADVLDSSTERAFLHSARLAGPFGKAELGERDGRAFLSFDISGGSVTFEATEAIVRKAAHLQRYRYEDAEAVTLFGDDLRRDAIYLENSSRFLRLAVERLGELEQNGQLANAKPVPLGGDAKRPGSAAWGGIEVFSFVDCMADCMAEDHWPTTCLLLCGAKAATVGGRLFPEK